MHTSPLLPRSGASPSWLCEPEAPYTSPKPRLLEQVRAAIRARHYSYRTETAYVAWIRRFILFHRKRHPNDMGKQEIERFLDEVSRVASPSGKIDAVLVETNGGATTSFGYEVYVLPKGGSWRWANRAAFLYGTTRSESAYGANLRWASEDVLAVEYLQTRSADLERSFTRVDGQDIRVELHAGIEDPSARPGGMLYNLEGRPHDPAPNKALQPTRAAEPNEQREPAVNGPRG